jgi:hypothetical protein
MSRKLPGNLNEEMPIPKPLEDNLDVCPWNDPTPRKSSFLPSKIEIRKAAKLAKAITRGWIKLEKKPEKPR